MSVQIIKCPCGEKFAACRVPECYEDAEWQRNMRAYVKKGCTVEVADKLNNFGNCTCKNMNPKNKEGSLFNHQ